VTMIGTTSSQAADLRSSGRSTRTTAVSLRGPGRPPGGTQLGPLQAQETRQMPAERHGGPRFPSTLQSLLSNDFRYAFRCCPISHCYNSTDRFKILVVGKVCII
jgi:hypothetical protein